MSKLSNQGYVHKNPSLNTIRKKIRRNEVTVLTPEQQKRLLKALKEDPVSTLIKTALGTGARLGELLALKWDNVDLDNKEIKIEHSLVRTSTFDDKTHKIHFGSPVVSDLKTESSFRTVPITNHLAQALKKYKHDQRLYMKSSAQNIYRMDNFVFTSTVGTHLEQANVRKQYIKFLKKAKVPYVKFHALRHTFATRVLEANIHPKIAQELLGHSTCSTTLDIYSHVLPSHKREAMDKLEGII